MPSDYNKLTKPDLEAQLKERGLPHTGKKAELVARLQEDDSKKTSAPDASAGKEDEIDWDDDAPKDAAPAAEPSNGAAPATVATQGQAQAPESSAPATTTNAEAPSAVPAAGGPSEEQKPQKDYSLGLAQVTISDELEKLKARARKFGLTEDQAAQDNIAKLERAQKFGGADDLSGLNGALPERQRKRRGDHKDDGERADKHRGRGGRGRGPRHEGGDHRQQTSSSGTNWMSTKDREAAEARKKRFGS